MKLVDKPLTEKQKKFSRSYVDAFYGKEYLSNTEVAIKAGYSPDSAYQRAYELLNPKICPHVVMYISKLKEDWKSKHNIDPDKHMARLMALGKKAEQKGNLSVAGRMEELRGRVAGYYVERKLVGHKKSLEDMTEEELNAEIKQTEEDWALIAGHDKKED